MRGKHGGDVREKVNDFSVNVNPFGYPKYLKRIIIENFSLISCYPDSYSDELRCEIAKLHSVSKDNIIVGNGSNEIIYLIPKIVPRPSTLIPSPTFSEYEYAVKNVNGKAEFINTLNYFDAEKIIQKAKKHNILFLCNPNNPTGKFLKISELKPLIKSCDKKGIITVIDEAFIDFVVDGHRNSAIPLMKKYDKLIVLKSLTKSFCIPGLRLGYAVASKATIEKLLLFKEPWTVNCFAQQVGITLMRDRTFLKGLAKKIAIERNRLSAGLKNIKCLKAFPSETNFLLVKILSKDMDARKLDNLLVRRGIHIRTPDGFRFLNNKYFRIAVKTKAENDLFLSNLENISKI